MSRRKKKLKRKKLKRNLRSLTKERVGLKKELSQLEKSPLIWGHSISKENGPVVRVISAAHLMDQCIIPPESGHGHFWDDDIVCNTPIHGRTAPLCVQNWTKACDLARRSLFPLREGFALRNGIEGVNDVREFLDEFYEKGADSDSIAQSEYESIISSLSTARLFEMSKGTLIDIANVSFERVQPLVQELYEKAIQNKDNPKLARVFLIEYASLTKSAFYGKDFGQVSPDESVGDIPFDSVFVSYSGDDEVSLAERSVRLYENGDKKASVDLLHSIIPPVESLYRGTPVKEIEGTCKVQLIGSLLTRSNSYTFGVYHVRNFDGEVVLVPFIDPMFGPFHQYNKFSLLSVSDSVLRASLFRSQKGTSISRPLRRALKRGSKKRSVRFSSVPEEYYRIDLSGEQEIKRTVRTSVTRRPISYRHDRAAHYRMRVRRGTLPMPQEELDRAKRLNYDVYENEAPSYVNSMLRDRGRKPLIQGEWIAVKVYRVSSTVVGDPSLPYRPGLRNV